MNSSRLSRRKLWVFRLVVLVVLPAVLFALAELGLRLAGFGHPTAFLLPGSRAGQDVFTQNNQFGWRFFAPQMARLPDAFSIPQRKPSGTVRVFVLGESAAKGEPQSQFGLPRMLQAMLSLRHPATRFEVVNAAMTAINSHAILPIARDCAQADGDIWVIYMGNNEVVGPFGAGTIFGRQTPPLAVIRGHLALKATRTGQWLESALGGLQKQPGEHNEWGGMQMFLDQQVPADDPRMKSVYHHFERNLAEILRIGQRSGVGIVVSTVAVNLRDCAPFASAHRPDLTEADKVKWEQVYHLGIKAQADGNSQEAAARFQETAQLDNTFAELRFRQGQCALALGKVAEAQQHFRAARDLDTLRFRCDSRINELTRQAAAGRESERILFTDVESAFANQSPNGLPGDNLFYEHVHPTFEGNYLIARTIAEQVEKLLPERTRARGEANPPWPSATECARRLAWTDWSRLSALEQILARLKEAPFTGQLDHATRLRVLTAQMEALTPVRRPAGIAAARQACEVALAAAPDDPDLHGQLATLKATTGDLAGGGAAMRRRLAFIPSDSLGWRQLGLILARQQQFEEANAAFRRAIALDPMDALSSQRLAQSLWAQGRRDEALREYRRALEFNPDSSVGWISLGEALESAGQKSEAEACYRKALATRPRRLTDLTALARFCQSRGWIEAAATNYGKAILLEPENAVLRVEGGRCLLELASAPNARGKAATAEQQFREALRLSPELLEARLHLGIALLTQGRSNEALAELEQVLQRDATNVLALKHAQEARKTGRETAR